MTHVRPCLMNDILPQSRVLSGAIVAIEGLAVWVVAIFLESLRATGWIIWPGADMYTTAVGTMLVWLTSWPPGAFELLGYFGLAVAIGGPAWFWIAKPTLTIMERRTTKRGSDRHSASADGRPWKDTDWIPATESPAESRQWDEDADSSAWISSTLDSNPSQPDSPREALARGDFLRGSTGDLNDRDAKNS